MTFDGRQLLALGMDHRERAMVATCAEAVM
jgi:hypothetical protein